MTVYIHGSKTLAKKLIRGGSDWVPLRFHHLARISRDDVIVSPRPWSPLLEIILRRNATSRPFIIQTADGIVFPLNCTKRKNMRFGGMQRFIFADVFLALQNADDFSLISDEPSLVETKSSFVATEKVCHVSSTSAILVAGNDPYFDFPRQSVIHAFTRTIKRLQDLGVKEILLSCPCENLSKELLSRFRFLRPIGRIVDFEGDVAKTLLVGSPSTVLLDHARQGGVSLLIDYYDDPVLTRYMSTDEVLSTASRTVENTICFKAKAIECDTQDLFTLPELLGKLRAQRPGTNGRRSDLSAEARNMWSIFSGRLIAREAHLLLGGRP